MTAYGMDFSGPRQTNRSLLMSGLNLKTTPVDSTR